VEHARGNNRAAALSRGPRRFRSHRPSPGLTCRADGAIPSYRHERSTVDARVRKAIFRHSVVGSRTAEAELAIRAHIGSCRVVRKSCPWHAIWRFRTIQAADSTLSGTATSVRAWRLATPASYRRWARRMDNPSFEAARRQLRVASFFGRTARPLLAATTRAKPEAPRRPTGPARSHSRAPKDTLSVAGPLATPPCGQLGVNIG